MSVAFTLQKLPTFFFGNKWQFFMHNTLRKLTFCYLTNSLALNNRAQVFLIGVLQRRLHIVKKLKAREDSDYLRICPYEWDIQASGIVL